MTPAQAAALAAGREVRNERLALVRDRMVADGFTPTCPDCRIIWAGDYNDGRRDRVDPYNLRGERGR